MGELFLWLMAGGCFGLALVCWYLDSLFPKEDEFGIPFPEYLIQEDPSFSMSDDELHEEWLAGNAETDALEEEDDDDTY